MFTLTNAFFIAQPIKMHSSLTKLIIGCALLATLGVQAEEEMAKTEELSHNDYLKRELPKTRLNSYLKQMSNDYLNLIKNFLQRRHKPAKRNLPYFLHRKEAGVPYFWEREASVPYFFHKRGASAKENLPYFLHRKEASVPYFWQREAKVPNFFQKRELSAKVPYFWSRKETESKYPFAFGAKKELPFFHRREATRDLPLFWDRRNTVDKTEEDIVARALVDEVKQGNKRELVSLLSPMLTRRGLNMVRQTPMITKKSPMLSKRSPMLSKRAPMLSREAPMISKKSPMLTKKSSM